jgi:uncharacterized protein (DUF362 family)
MPSLRSSEKIGCGDESTDMNVCTTLQTQDLRSGGTGSPGCVPILSRLLRRRDWLIASAGTLALGGCARRPQPGAEPRVSITRAAAYTQDLYDSVRRILAEHRLEVRGKQVVIKPNLVEYDPQTVINTHPRLVHAALEAFRSMGAAEVRIAEGPGHRRGTLDLAEAAGYFEAIPRFEDLFTDLNLDETSRIRLSRPSSRLEGLYLPRTALAADLVVSMPKMKTHHWVGATLGMKNLFGVVPGGVYGWPKNVLHWAGIEESIADLQRVFGRVFTIVDGIVGMEGNGPIQGKPKPAGVIVAGGDRVAVDATCCRIMRIDPRKIRYLKLSESLLQTEEENVRQIAESVKSVQTPFELISECARLRLS